MRSGFNLLVVFICLLLTLSFSPAAFADSGSDRTQFGTDITIGPNEQVGDVNCFGCSVRVHGRVATDVTVFFGTVTIEEQGEVGGDVTDFGRGVRLDKNAKVGGDVTAFGGPVRRHAEASVGGDVTNFNGVIWLAVVFGLPLAILAAVVALIVWIVRLATRPRVPATA